MTESTTLQRTIRVLRKKDFLEIRIPLKKNTTALIALIAATIAWIIALFIVIRITLIVHHFWIKAGLILAIGAWFALGMAGASAFIWLFFGRERIIVSKEFLVTDKPLVFFYRRNFYDIETISNIHIDIELFKINRNGEWKDEQRTVIKFDTPEKQVTFARGVDKVEAENILLEMAKSSFLSKTQFAVEQKI
ncbi:MAG TPA: hypothetical protein PK431_01400 [Chitinophagales bacterium]|nr:hypothetical protein [Chitinophagales bacterium]